VNRSNSFMEYLTMLPTFENDGLRPVAPSPSSPATGICEVFGVPMSKLVRGLDKEGVYEKLDVEIPQRRR